MRGRFSSATIEIGLDITDLLEHVSEPGNWDTFFLVVDAKSPQGALEELTLMDYTSGSLVQVPAKMKNSSFQKGRNLVPVARQNAGSSRQKAVGISPSLLIKVRTIDGTTQIFPHSAVEVLSLFDVSGARSFSIQNMEAGEWHSMPGSLPRGLVWARAIGRDGGVRTVPLMH